MDTNVVAAAILGEPGTEEARRLLSSHGRFVAPSHWKAEFCSVVWKAARRFGLAGFDLDRALQAISLAEAVQISQVDVGELWKEAMGISLATGVSPYDTLFVELGHRLQAPVVSDDRQLQKSFPKVVISSAEALALLP